jgi:hypothetical protein
MYAWCQDMPGVAVEDYAALMANLSGAEREAAGLVVHVSGPVAGGFRIVNVWESKDAADRFHREVIQPAVARVHGHHEPDVPAGLGSSTSADDQRAFPRP